MNPSASASSTTSASELQFNESKGESKGSNDSKGTGKGEGKDKGTGKRVHYTCAPMYEITDDFRVVFDGFTLDFKEHGKPPKLVVLQHGSHLFVQGAKLGDEVIGVKHPADKVLHRAKSIDAAAELLCESTSLTLRRLVAPTPAVSDPRRVPDTTLTVKMYPKPVYPCSGPFQ